MVKYEYLSRTLLSFILLSFAVVFPTMGQQSKMYTGTVYSSETNRPIEGVSVVSQQTNKATSTNKDGEFTFELAGNDRVLTFSYLGFLSKTITRGTESSIVVYLDVNDARIDEVVVTALGIKREKKSLGYSVGNVAGEALTETPQTSVLNALSGKVAGVQISQMDGAAGSSVNMAIRGIKSLNSDNQPLFVIDGVPVSNKLNNQFAGADMGNAISDINPNDIENISVLKGPSAAALYGSRAGNGVVIITTKSGRAQKKGVGVSLNSALVADFPYKYLPVQNKFASGKVGAHLFEESENENWGAELDVGEKWVQWNSNGEEVPLVSYPNRFKDFFKTGFTATNNISLNGNYDKGNFRLSAGSTEAKGIIPNTDLSRLNIALNTTYNLTDRFRATANFNVTESGSDNRPIIDGGRNSPVRSLYETGAQVNILDMKDYWLTGSEGMLQKKYKEKQNNPFFIAHENPTGFKRDRTVSKLQLDYDINKDFSLMGRYSRDATDEVLEAKRAYSNFDYPKGGYELTDISRRETNLDLILTYNKVFNEDWSLNALAGANRLEQKSRSIVNIAGELVVPGVYSISNGVPGTVFYDSDQSKKILYGAFASASVGYKERVYLDLTARNDWSSTLPKGNNSYFYPSASLSLIVSEMIDMPEWINLTKLRMGSARVGNDVAPYSLVSAYANASDWGAAKRLYMGEQLKNATLKPEISTSNEVGIDVSLFNNRLGLEATYYVVDNKNQVLPIALPIESGASNKLINAGLVRSKGVEIALTTTPVVAGDFRWDMNVSFSRNRASIEKLAEGITYFPFVSYSDAEIRTYEGGQIGDIYMKPVLTVKDQSSPYYGYPLLTSGGLYQADNNVNNMVKIGNFNHDFMISFQPTFRYKSVSLYANIDWRQGGSFFSNTMMFLGNNGQLEETLSGANYDRNRNVEDQVKANPEAYFGKWIGGRTADYGGLPWPGAEGNIREHDASFNVGVRQQVGSDGSVDYVENLGGPSTVWLNPFNAYRYANRPFPDRNLYSATYVKLREIAITYHLSSNFLNKIKLQNASVSVVANNIWQWTKAGIGVDPERAFRQTGNGWEQGVEYYNVMPWTGSVGVKLNVSF